MFKQTMFGTFTADGYSPEFIIKGDNPNVDSGLFLHCSGTFGGGGLVLQFLGMDGTWHTITDAGFTDAADKHIQVPNVRTYRLWFVGSTSPSVYYEVTAAGSSIIEQL